MTITGAWERLEQFALGLLLLVIAGLLILQVAVRLLETSSFGWVEEASRFLFVWLVFLGAGIAVRRDAHIKADILRPKSQRRPAMAWLAFLEGLVAMAGLLLVIYGIGLVEVSANTSLVTLGFSTGYRSAAVAAGGCLVLVFSLMRLLRLLRLLLAPAERPRAPGQT